MFKHIIWCYGIDRFAYKIFDHKIRLKGDIKRVMSVNMVTVSGQGLEVFVGIKA